MNDDDQGLMLAFVIILLMGALLFWVDPILNLPNDATGILMQ